MSDMRTLFADPIEICALCSRKCHAGVTSRSTTAAVTAVPSGADPDGLQRALLDQQVAQTDQLHTLLCSLNLPILHLCPDMRLCFFTQAAEQMFGIRSADLGTRLDLCLPLAPASEVTEIRRTAGSGRSGGDSVAGPQGVVWQCRILPHFARDGAPGGAMVILLAQSETAPADPPLALEDDLTPRQRQVMDLVLAGHPSKNIAADLKISQRTVENHRAAIMRRTGATSLPALARMALGAALGADRSLRHGSRAVADSLA